MLHEIMGWDGPMTNRQYLVWIEWLKGDWNNPSRSDHYQMQTACEVRRVLSSEPNKIQSEQFKIPFVFKEVSTNSQTSLKEKPKEGRGGITQEQMEQQALARWVGMMPKEPVRVKGSKFDGNGNRSPGS